MNIENHRNPNSDRTRTAEMVGSLVLLTALSILVVVSSDWSIWLMIAAAAALLVVGWAYFWLWWMDGR